MDPGDDPTAGEPDTTDYADGEERRHTAEIFRDNRLWLILLGRVLVGSGLVQVMQAAKMRNWMGFIWHLTLGILGTVGGALIYMDPFARVIALSLLIAGMFALHGVTQIAFAEKVRGQMGRHWFLISGCIAFVVAVLSVLKLPHSHSFTPAIVAGASLLFAGWATLPWRSRRAKPRPEDELCLASPLVQAVPDWAGRFRPVSAPIDQDRVVDDAADDGHGDDARGKVNFIIRYWRSSSSMPIS